jgi:hypothetical protein
MLVIYRDIVHVTDVKIVLWLVQVVEIPTVVKVPGLDDPVGVGCEETTAVVVEGDCRHGPNVVRVNLDNGGVVNRVAWHRISEWFLKS